MDFASGQVLCSLDPHRRLYPASLTKMMTAVLVAERCRPDEWVTVSAEAAAVGETSLNLQAGQQVTVRDLLTGAVVKSANDAAAALACHLSGSQAKFADLMNIRARELGLRGTHFVNPHGLHHPNHYTTAADLATLARAFMTYPLLREITRLPEADLPSLQPGQSRHVWNQNRLLRRWGECTGIKGGYTRQAGKCVAAAARRGGWDLICVVLKSGEVWEDARRLLEWGFANYRRVLPTAALREGCQVRVWGGKQEYVPAALGGTAAFVLPRGARADWQVELLPQDQRAPVTVGQEVGTALVRLPGQAERRLPLVALADVPPLEPVVTQGQALWAVLLLSGAVLLYGTASKILGTRRRRLAAGQRAFDLRGARVGGRQSGDLPRRPGRPRPQRGAGGRKIAARARRVPLRRPK